MQILPKVYKLFEVEVVYESEAEDSDTEFEFAWIRWIDDAIKQKDTD